MVRVLELVWITGTGTYTGDWYHGITTGTGNSGRVLSLVLLVGTGIRVRLVVK